MTGSVGNNNPPRQHSLTPPFAQVGLSFAVKTVQMRARQGEGAFSTGVYLPYTTKKSAPSTPYCEVYNSFLSAVVAIYFDIIIRQIAPPSYGVAVAAVERDKHFYFFL